MAAAINLQETTVEPQTAVLAQISGFKLWRYTFCNGEMLHVSKADHFAERANARELKLVGPLSPVVPSHASSRVVAGTTVAHNAKSKKR